jgi:hypothetical protein
MAHFQGLVARRAFLLLIAFLAVGFPFLRRLLPRAPSSEESRLLKRTLCDRLLPRYLSHPGAVQLELPDLSELIPYFSPLAIDLLTHEFLKMDESGQNQFLKERLAEAGPYREFHFALLRLYFTNPASWKSLQYSKPQPLGYPEANG